MSDEDIQQRIEAGITAALARMGADATMRSAQRAIDYAVPGMVAANAPETPYVGKGRTQDGAPTAMSEAGKRTGDAFTWRQVGTGSISVGNVMIGYKGLVKEYTGATLTIGTSGTYVYADVEYAVDESGNVTGIDTVSLLTTPLAGGDMSVASAEVLDESFKPIGLHIPLGRFKSASGTWGSTVVCMKRYFDGAVMLYPPDDAAGWTTDANRELIEGFDQYSVEYVVAEGTDAGGKAYTRYLQLVNFELGDDADVLTADDETAWSDPVTGASSQRMLVRKVVAEGKIRLHYKLFNPLPSGDATCATVKWDNTVLGYKKAVPVDTENDDTDTTPLAEGNRVVVRLQTSPHDGSLLQLVTKPMGAMGGGGGTPSGYTETTVPVSWQYDSSSHKWQFKTATVLVKDGTLADTWSDGIAFAAFND